MMEADWLQGKQVAITGRLACLTQAEAAEVVCAHGGKFVASVSRQTDFLVVGQEGLPLRKDGRLPTSLLKAQRLQLAGSRIVILNEDDFLARLGLDGSQESHARLYTTAELTRILKLPRDRLRAWVQTGLIQPVESRHGIGYFDFQQVAGAKSLMALTKAGVSADLLRRSLRQLQTWIRVPIDQLALVESNGHVTVRLEQGQLAEASGQMLLDFHQHDDLQTIESKAKTTTDWFDEGCRHEDEGRLREAAEAYGQALLEGGPDSQTCFNLGNVHFALGEKHLAAERFRQAVEMDRDFAEAWNNLGNVLAEMGQLQKALAALEQALKIDPHYADAHYNIADVLEQLGRKEAKSHWLAYLRQDQQSAWARHARERLEASKPA